MGSQRVEFNFDSDEDDDEQEEERLRAYEDEEGHHQQQQPGELQPAKLQGQELNVKSTERRKKNRSRWSCWTLKGVLFGLIFFLATSMVILAFFFAYFTQSNSDVDLILDDDDDKCGKLFINNLSESEVRLNEKTFRALRQAKYHDCAAFKRRDSNVTSGVFNVRLRHGEMARIKVRVWCDMETEGGGWTVIQRRGRFENEVDFFNRTFSNYSLGFGDEEGEFFIGLRVLQALTSMKKQDLLVEMKTGDGKYYNAQYSNFAVKGQDFRLHFDRFQFGGNASDCLASSLNAPFSAFDHDEDANDGKNCAADEGGGWWFTDCSPANLNALGLSPSDDNDNNDTATFYWNNFVEHSDQLLEWTEMKIRPAGFKR